MAIDMDKLQEFLGRFVTDLGATFAAGNVVTGHHLGLYRAGVTFSRYYWQLELDADLEPTGRDIVAPPGPPGPR